MDLTVAGAARRFRDGSLTPTALIDEILGLIERENPRLNAFYQVFGEECRRSAEKATEELRNGTDRGPLHGIPLAVKDLFDMAGHPTNAGSSFIMPAAKKDSDAVARLRKAGAVLVGKAALHEWALGVTNNNPHHGPTRNPHDMDRSPGGSSGGTGAAVAAGLSLAGLGTDTGGSIRIPASLCGIVGLKPSFGLVSTEGVFPLAVSLDHPGPMGLTVEDVYLLLEAMCDWKPSDAPKPRFLIQDRYFFEGLNPGVEKLVRAVAESVGAQPVDVGDVQKAWDANTVLLLSEAGAFHRQRLDMHPEKFGPGVRKRMEMGLEYVGADIDEAQWTKTEWRATLQDKLGEDGVLVTPTTVAPAPLIEDSAREVSTAKNYTKLTSPFNLAGTPAVSLPCGKVDHLPVGIQLVAAPGKESLLRAAAELIESTIKET